MISFAHKKNVIWYRESERLLATLVAQEFAYSRKLMSNSMILYQINVKCIVKTKIFWCVLYKVVCPTQHFLF